MSVEAMLVELPGGRLYLNDCRIQTFTYNDAYAISLLAKTNDSQKLFEIIDRRINLDVSSLTIQDFWFILYWQRINSYSTYPIKLPWTCRECETKNLDELSGSKLIINDLDPDYYHGMELNFTGIGPVSIRLKLIKDDETSRRFIREKGWSLDNQEIFNEVLTACRLELDGGSLEERLSLVKRMTADDHFLLSSFDEEFNYGVQNYSEFVCENEKCKEVAKVRYSFDLARFFPSLQDKSNVRSRILPRKTSKSTDSKPPRHGLNESNPHEGHSHKELKEAPREAESVESPDEGEEKVALTPEELQRMIEVGVQRALSDEEDDGVTFGTLDDINSNR